MNLLRQDFACETPVDLPAGSALRVNGGTPLSGSVRPSGFKHSLVTVLSAAAAAAAPVRVTNCPDIAETAVLTELLGELGATVRRSASTLVVDGSTIDGSVVDLAGADRIHGAVYLVPALLCRTGRARVATGGGCRIGDGPAGWRPVEQYVGVLRRFGAQAGILPDGDLDVSAGRLRGCELDLLDYTSDRHRRSGPLYSGATKMALLAAAVAEGTSTIRNPYPKPDVTDLVTVLRQLGADIETSDADTLVVRGAGPGALCHDAEHALVPDLIEVVTWISAAATVAGSDLRITGDDLARATAALAPELAVLERMGVTVQHTADELVVRAEQPLRATEVTVASHDVYSDSQPFLALLAAHAVGTSHITETVWSGRFGYVPGLCALGARMRERHGVLRVDGPYPPSRAGRHVHATDLRAAAVLVLAALGVPGPTVLHGVHHLARGYQDLPATLRTLGADISEVMEEQRV
ncbi:MAG TPA: hypothetical protein VFM55_26460 [Micromonosporaceae bacterium]|nr:hypothetical protein [Micromonosporaceae bacterium]